VFDVRLPVSHTSVDPASDVAVCGVGLSWFVHVTVVLAVTVSGVGLKAKFAILRFGVTPLLPAGDIELLHDANNMTPAIPHAIPNVLDRIRPPV
jgi:hypothetical protein